MKNSILIAVVISAFAVPALADDLTLEDVRAMSDDELYALAETLSSEDETRLYQQARKQFPSKALGLQASRDELAKSSAELDACADALENNQASELRALTELEPGRYLSLLRIVSEPSKEVLDMTINERVADAKKVGRKTNRILRDFRDCKRKYRKRFGVD